MSKKTLIGRYLIGSLALFVTACQTLTEPHLPSSVLRCDNAAKWAGQVVGDGHCVSLIKLCSGAPATPSWRPGKRVRAAELPQGTVIATFRGDRYPSVTGYHAAIYIKQDQQGIWVWDQWQGKAVHKRLIPWHNPGATAANTGTAYRVVVDSTR